MVQTAAFRGGVQAQMEPTVPPAERFHQTFSVFTCTGCDGSIPPEAVKANTDPRTGIRTILAACPHCGVKHTGQFALQGDTWRMMPGTFSSQTPLSMEDQINAQMEAQRQKDIADLDRRISVTEQCLSELQVRRDALLEAPANPADELTYTTEDAHTPHVDAFA